MATQKKAPQLPSILFDIGPPALAPLVPSPVQGSNVDKTLPMSMSSHVAMLGIHTVQSPQAVLPPGLQSPILVPRRSVAESSPFMDDRVRYLLGDVEIFVVLSVACAVEGIAEMAQLGVG